MAKTRFQNGHSYTISRRFDFDKDRRPMVMLTVVSRNRSVREFTLLADTGAGPTLMSEAEARQLGIKDIKRGYLAHKTIRTAGPSSITAYFHPFLATVPGTGRWFRILIGFSPDVRSSLFGRSDMLNEFVLAFDSGATYFLRD